MNHRHNAAALVIAAAATATLTACRSQRQASSATTSRTDSTESRSQSFSCLLIDSIIRNENIDITLDSLTITTPDRTLRAAKAHFSGRRTTKQNTAVHAAEKDTATTTVSTHTATQSHSSTDFRTAPTFPLFIPIIGLIVIATSLALFYHWLKSLSIIKRRQ